MGKPGDQPDPLQRDRAHGARIYDYLLGGKDNYDMDRAAGDASVKVWPALPIHMHAGRSFMHRVGRYLAREAGIRQFLDIGTGIPTKPNLHEIVQEVAPDARIVYVDNDPIVLAHSRALMHGTREGRIEYIDGDMRDPEAILAAPQLRDTLDLTQPIGLLLISMLHFIEDDDEALRVVRRVMDVLPPGSYFAATIATDEFNPEPLAKVRETYHEFGETLEWRTSEQALRFFEGLQLVEPGLVQMHKWRPNQIDVGKMPADEDIAMYGAVGRKV
jgi:hypothetical protein